MSDIRTGPATTDEAWLFAESAPRFLVEVTPANREAFEACLGKQVPLTLIGETRPEVLLRIARTGGGWAVSTPLVNLRHAWQQPLRA